jgi:hypothetical protein
VFEPFLLFRVGCLHSCGCKCVKSVAFCFVQVALYLLGGMCLGDASVYRILFGLRFLLSTAFYWRFLGLLGNTFYQLHFNSWCFCRLLKRAGGLLFGVC